MKYGICLAIAGACACMFAATPAAQAQEAQEKNPIVLITGLDGAPYEAYKPAVIEKVQTALKNEGLYQGEVTGELDQTTMEAIGEFQKANDLTVSGVPSPETRKRLFGEG